MKKIEVTIRSDLKDAVVTAIKKNNVVGIDVSHIQGSKNPPLVGQYYGQDKIICVISESKLNDVLNSIANTACTNTIGDGKVFITTVDDSLNLCTKKYATMSI
jgi:nitrogen regulatory protein P-II 1